MIASRAKSKTVPIINDWTESARFGHSARRFTAGLSVLFQGRANSPDNFIVPALSISAESSVPDLAIVIVNYNTCQLVLDCLDSIYRSISAPLNIDCILVDNASSDGSVEAIRAKYPQVQLIANAKNVY